MTSPRYMLGIESSCDETAVSLVERSGAIRINAVASQIDLHAKFGGVVPEEASRRHIETCLPLIQSTLAEVGVGWDQIDGIAVTYAPGLIGCLLIGVETAKALAWRHDKPLYAVHHLHGHLHAPYLLPPQAEDGRQPMHLLIHMGKDQPVVPLDSHAEAQVIQPGFPHLGLIISGGHTSLALVEAPGKCRTVATTRDDAVGEAYDKVARILGIGFPGGPVVDRRAALGRADRFAFKVPMKRKDETDFSFSGLKSAVARKVEELKSDGNGSSQPLVEETINDLCAGFQATAIEALLSKSLAAARLHRVRDLLIVGGVASNRGLRNAAREAQKVDTHASTLRIWFPHISLCTDNAAMIAGLAWHLEPLKSDASLALNPLAVLPLD